MGAADGKSTQMSSPFENAVKKAGSAIKYPPKKGKGAQERGGSQ
jgi:hypothetical protein